jgi:2-polyprenyl-6-methoxyphenol hydroxylase-like FAD-dependent oxidoreductase
MQTTSLIVVGAGPVGMLASLLAAERGITVALFEKSAERSVNSRAIGITPPSLEILRIIGIDNEFISNGICVEYSEAHSRFQKLGSLNFRYVKGDYPFILSIPQDRTESILEKTILANNNIKLYRGYNVDEISDKDKITIHGKQHKGRYFKFSADYLIAADGGKSTIRNNLGVPFKGSAYRHTFLMGDFDDNTGWGNSARLYFTPRGSVESFPMPGNRRRYILRTADFIKENTTDFLQKEILLRTGVNVEKLRKYWESGFGVQHFTADCLAIKHVFFCGDSGHIMSPIGGQNMNTGFADAELAVWLIEKLINENTTSDKAINLYNRTRKRAIKSATWRAEMMMRMGTSGGSIWSSVRAAFVAAVLHTSLSALLLPVFTMQSIPFRNIRAHLDEYEKEVSRC